jgi:light-regulated signal transduction histidine kinase (bacteriophytochrome)
MAEADLDLSACDREPIHIPGSIQPHGALLVLRAADSTILQRSANVDEVLGIDSDPVGRTLDDVLSGGADLSRDVAAWLDDNDTTYLRTREIGGQCFNITGHRADDAVLLEFEAVPEGEAQSLEALHPQLHALLDELHDIRDFDRLNAAAARMVRHLTGFDRVLIYRFDEDWNGTVIAEDRNDALPSYLDLRFPASDIPAQARELYRRNRLRIIPDATYTPVPVGPAGAAPLDLSKSVLRSVSPVHCEYMRNMGTMASMSISLLIDGNLWGLISCHNAAPRRVSAHVRAACELLGRIHAAQIGARLRMEDAAGLLRLKSMQGALLASMAKEGGLVDGLVARSDDLLAFAAAQGAVIATADGITRIGAVPEPQAIDALLAWLETRGAPDVFFTNEVGRTLRGMTGLAPAASGLLAISISRLHPSYIVWFRPEVVETVTWGGDPHKRAEVDAGRRLHPRTSFEQWREQVRGRSLPWQPGEIESARDLRGAILGIVLRQAEERAELSGELERSNKELEAFSYSISHDLRAPFRHIVGYAELLQDRERTLDDKSRHYLDNIIDAAKSAGRLVDDLLSFSHIGRTSLARERVDMEKIVDEARRTLVHETDGRDIDWRIERLPVAVGDPAMLRQVIANLIGNAVKYTRGSDPSRITVSGAENDEELVYSVADDGVGFDMTYGHKLFGVFQRLHRVEEFEGTGIGLAIAKRIVERHGGRIWANGRVGEGATFAFSLPKRSVEKR